MVGESRWGCPGPTSAGWIASCFRHKPLWAGFMLSARGTPTGSRLRDGVLARG